MVDRGGGAGRVARGMAAAFLALLTTGVGLPPGASWAQPNPTAASVQEGRLLDELRRVEGRVTIPDGRAALLIQPRGRDWRAFRTDVLPWVGGVGLLGTLGLLAGFYAYRGRIRVEAGVSGRTLRRFGWFERFVHWMTAACFVLLALSGLNLSFGRQLVLPLVGPEAFTAISAAGKVAHNFLGFPFLLGVLLMLGLWVRDNLPDRTDLAWLKAGGGLLGIGPDRHPPARRFNAGQKGIFWTVVGGGLAISASGFLMSPFAATGIGGMQAALIVHALLAVLMVAVILAHVYIGSIGMQGAFGAMGSGRVDLNWAKEHHSLRAEEELAKAARPRRTGDAPPAGAGAVPAE